MNRRRILTGLVAAPFVARLGLLMPVRSIEPAWSGVVTIQWRLAQGTWVLPVKELDRALDAGWPLQEIVKQTSRPPLIDAGQKLIAQIIDHRSTLALSSERQPACGDPTCQ